MAGFQIGTLRTVAGAEVAVRGDADDYGRVELVVYEPHTERPVRVAFDTRDLAALERIVYGTFVWMLDDPELDDALADELAPDDPDDDTPAAADVVDFRRGAARRAERRRLAMAKADEARRDSAAL